MSTTKHVIPRCFGASRSVRAMMRPHFEKWAPVVQTFWPFNTQSPDAESRSARVSSEATSEPAFGSDQSWHQISEPSSIFGRKRSICSCVP